MGEPLTDVVCIVVHHNSPDTLSHTLQALLLNDVPSGQILVVDNSTGSQSCPLPTSGMLPVLRTSNRGYAAAVNSGLAHLKANGLDRPLTLVSTHESLAELGAVRALRDEILDDPRVAVAGPTLVNADEGRPIWSTGGRLTPALKLPRHCTDRDERLNEVAIDREWLDGAFTMYRTVDLEAFGLDETYFLYFEETDLHTRLRRADRRVIWVPRATVSQSSSGIPPRLLGRNLFLFHRKLYSEYSGRLAVTFELARAVGRALLTSRGRWSALPQIAKGWREGERLTLSTASGPASD